MLHINFITNDNSQISWTLEGMLMRLAYLFADTTILSGHIYYRLGTDVIFGSDAPESHKIFTVRKYGPLLNPSIPAADIETMYKKLKWARNVKHKNSDTVKDQKWGEHILDKLYGHCVDYIKAELYEGRYEEFAKLFDTDEVVYIPCDTSNGEEKSGNFVPFSEILREKWESDDQVYILPGSFMQYFREKGYALDNRGEYVAGNEGVWFALPVFPPLNLLSSPELQLLRREMQETAPVLRENIAQWSEQLREEKFSPALSKVYWTHYIDKLGPDIAALLELVKESEILEKPRSFYRDKIGTRNLLCITRADILWDYLEWKKLVPEESMKKFKADLPPGCTGDSAVLLFVCLWYDELGSLFEESDKKSLQL